ncbi:LysM domain domain-containing protein, putative [Eimeria mitis]|uniref:LysM domain domain-containing protein, putative n=1 Tax=Eimeria mitis TaxID=44415 RepID=U6K184_9EIME|nr:LysM domain domain-containing protein, putative [Eimeria mitis]CDJ31429.1 LysM domain domain-containing protein, putative [Eimeria mitis]
MNVTAAELVSYLLLHNQDIERAHTALVEDANWHAGILRQTRERLRRQRGSPWWLNLPLTSSRALQQQQQQLRQQQQQQHQYMMIQSSSSLLAEGSSAAAAAAAATAATAAAEPWYPGAAERGLTASLGPHIIGNPSSSNSSNSNSSSSSSSSSPPLGAIDTSCIPFFYSSSLDGIRRRRRGRNMHAEPSLTIGAAGGAPLGAPLGAPMGAPLAALAAAPIGALVERRPQEMQ